MRLDCSEVTAIDYKGFLYRDFHSSKIMRSWIVINRLQRNYPFSLLLKCLACKKSEKSRGITVPALPLGPFWFSHTNYCYLMTGRVVFPTKELQQTQFGLYPKFFFKAQLSGPDRTKQSSLPLGLWWRFVCASRWSSPSCEYALCFNVQQSHLKGLPM